MENKRPTISACLIVFNEEKIIERCLNSVKDLADEIILIHDGPCTDKTLEIAKKYTDKIFVREHGFAVEPHLVYAFKQAKSEWLLRFDADEFFDIADHDKIRKQLASNEANGYILDWEFWDGKKVVSFKGIQKACFFRRENYHYIGVLQESGWVDGGFKKISITLRHRPKYDNTSWKEVFRKANQWVPLLAQSFFPELVKYECFNTTPDKWVNYALKVRKHPVFYIIFFPVKTFLAQLKNGLWANPVGWKLVLQTYIIYFSLYWKIWRIQKDLNRKKASASV